MKANEAIKRILSKDTNALRAVHDLVNVDFEKPFTAFVIESRYTANMILKQAAGHTPDNSIICVLTYGGNSCFKDEIYFATLGSCGKFEIDHKPPYSYNKKRCFIHKYYGRGDFEKARKNNDFSVIICQNYEYIAEKNDHPVDFSNRFKVADYRIWGDGHGNSYIGEIDTIRTDDNGSHYAINKRGAWGYNRSYSTLDEIIDKSGYITYEKRHQLKHDARILRAEREKAAYTANDYTKEVAEIKAQAEAKKADIMRELEKATTAEDIKAISKKLDIWRGLAGVYEDIVRLEAQTISKAYASIADYKKAAGNITTALMAL